MKHNLIMTLIFLVCTKSLFAQTESKDYIEFNDRKTVVHGVYMGIDVNYGEMNNKDAYLGSFKVAYVANRKIDIGFKVVGFYSDQGINKFILNTDEHLFGVYGGIHIEPILFSKSTVNVSFPLLAAGGGVGSYIGELEDEQDIEVEDWDPVVVFEPGVNLLFNISRYIQIETGVKYRISSRVKFANSSVKNINGYSAGIGIKVGIFNIGKNRYKKN